MDITKASKLSGVPCSDLRRATASFPLCGDDTLLSIALFYRWLTQLGYTRDLIISCIPYAYQENENAKLISILDGRYLCVIAKKNAFDIHESMEVDRPTTPITVYSINLEAALLQTLSRIDCLDVAEAVG